MGSVVVFAPERKSIQCHLWHCQRAYQPYCSSFHSDLAIQGEQGRNAIVIADGMKDHEMNEISGKIVRSTVEGNRCGIPHVDPNDLCMNPWEHEGFVFNRELEMEETRRSWVFFCEKNLPDGFESFWKSSGVSKQISPGIFCQKYNLKPIHVAAGGRFMLSKVTGRERFRKALYWMTYLAERKVEEPEEEGKVSVVTSSEGENSKRKQIESDTSQLPPNKVMKTVSVDGAMENPNTNVSHSVHVLAHKLDMYVFCSYSHNVAAKGKCMAFVSTDAETDNPQTELKAGIDLLCPVDDIFFDMYDIYKSLNVPAWGNCFISTVFHMVRGEAKAPEHIGAIRDYNVNMMPKDYNENDSKTHSATMSHPIPNTNDAHSVHVIIPQKQLAHKSDMYVFCCSYSHDVAPKGKFIRICLSGCRD